MIAGALEDLDVAAAIAAFRDQASHGHTAESDAETPVECFGDQAYRRSAELADVLRSGGNRNLPVAYRRAARLAAFAFATMRRIRVEQAREGSTDQ